MSDLPEHVGEKRELVLDDGDSGFVAITISDDVIEIESDGYSIWLTTAAMPYTLRQIADFLCPPYADKSPLVVKRRKLAL